MCTGAIFWSGIRRVVFSFPALDLGAMADDKFWGPAGCLRDIEDGGRWPNSGRRSQCTWVLDDGENEGTADER
jgi:hypothetical protein